MPKYVVSPLIYEGIYEFILRFSINKSAQKTHAECANFKIHGNLIYFHKDYPKKEYTLEDVQKIRNEKVKFYEDCGLRKKKCGVHWNTLRLESTK